MSHDWLIDQHLMSPIEHIIGHIGDGFLWVKWPNQQCQSTEGSSGQVHLTMLQ